MHSNSNHPVIIIIFLILFVVCLPGCHAIGNPTQAADTRPIEFTSITELCQKQKEIAGQPDDPYQLSTLTEMYMPKMLSELPDGPVCERISITKNYYCLDFGFIQDEAVLNRVSNKRDNHFLLSHIQLQVRRDPWLSQASLDSRAEKNPDEYQKISQDGQDYFISAYKITDQGSAVIISRTIYWVKSDHLFQMNLPGTIPLEEIYPYFDLVKVSVG